MRDAGKDDYAGSGLDGPRAPASRANGGAMIWVTLLGVALVLASAILLHDQHTRD